MSPDDAETRYNSEWPALNRALMHAKSVGVLGPIKAARQALSALSIKYDDRHRVEPEPVMSIATVEQRLSELHIRISRLERNRR